MENTQKSENLLNLENLKVLADFDRTAIWKTKKIPEIQKSKNSCLILGKKQYRKF